MVWYVSSTDISTLNHLLRMHRSQRCQLNYLETWVYGFPDYLEIMGEDLVDEETNLDKDHEEKKNKAS